MSIVKKVQEKKDYYIQFSDEECENLGIKENEKFNIKVHDDNSILMTPFEKIDIDISEFKREVLEMLISISAEKDISVNDVISELLEQYFEREENK